jgi:hypothetical protein
MIVLIDNDVILKLCKWDLLNELIDHLGVPAENIVHLPTCEHVLCPSANHAKALKRCGNEETINRIKAFCSATKAAPRPADAALLELLNNIPEIDVGEIVLFTLGVEWPGSITFIGDKRSLLALAASPSANKICESLSGRLKCLEQILAELLLAYGEMVKVKVRGCLSADRAVAMAFGSVESTTDADIFVGLLSYYNFLLESTGRLLAPFPPMEIIASVLHMELSASHTS